MKATASGLLLILVASLVTSCGGDRSTMSGDELATEIGCFACHSEENTDIAPTLHGIWGGQVTFEDGTSTVVDEDYVRQSIMDPGARIVDGYDGRMPNFGLSDQEVDRLIEYVRSLS